MKQNLIDALGLVVGVGLFYLCAVCAFLLG